MVVMMMMSLCIRSEYLLIKVSSDLFCTRYIKLLFIFINFMDFLKLIYRMLCEHFGDSDASNTCTCFLAT